MSTFEFIIALFCRVDDAMHGVPKHPHAKLWPFELVTLALLMALKGGSHRTFDRWIRRDLLPFFPQLPHRTRLLRSLAAPRHRAWAERFLAEPTFFGIIDSYGIELIHPRRRGRSQQQIGSAGISNHRWIAGAKLCAAINQHGLFCDWDLDTASTHDTHFHVIAKRLKDSCLFADSGFHKSEKRGGNPDNLYQSAHL